MFETLRPIWNLQISALPLWLASATGASFAFRVKHVALRPLSLGMALCLPPIHEALHISCEQAALPVESGLTVISPSLNEGKQYGISGRQENTYNRTLE
jgi:hypothetical protein